jgi:YidC/Oxa1 family membrane protein insertase
MDIFHAWFYIPIINILVFLYRLFGSDLGLALITVAVVSRAITIPLTNRQIKSAEKNKEFQEKYNKLKKKYKKNKEKLNQEAAKLQAEYLPSQLGGCLPMIFQLILFIQIYNVLRNLFARGFEAFNESAYPFMELFPSDVTINGEFLGGVINLVETPSNIGFENFGAFLPYLVLMVLVVIAQFISTRLLSGGTFGANSKKKDDKKDSKKKKKDDDEPDFSEIMQSTSQQMMYVLPLMIGLVSYSVPAGLTLYWTVQSTFVIIQRVYNKRKEIISWYKSRNSKDGQNKKDKNKNKGDSKSSKSKTK